MFLRVALSKLFKLLAAVCVSAPPPHPAMDPRTQKRISSVAHIKSKAYYRPVIEEPDPIDEACSTRMWRFKMKVWVATLKRRQTCDEDQPQHEDAAPDVIAGSE